MTEQVNHPSHYGGADNPHEAIKVIEAWDLGFCLGNAVKYISRAGRKDPDTHLQDLEKAAWYLGREIGKLREVAALRDELVTEGKIPVPEEAFEALKPEGLTYSFNYQLAAGALGYNSGTYQMPESYTLNVLYDPGYSCRQRASAFTLEPDAELADVLGEVIKRFSLHWLEGARWALAYEPGGPTVDLSRTAAQEFAYTAIQDLNLISVVPK